MKNILTAITACLVLTACPGSVRPNNWINPDAVRQPFLNIVERHDMYIRAGFQPPVLDPATNQMVVGERLTVLEQSTWLNESAILKKIVVENSGTTNPVPVEQ